MRQTPRSVRGAKTACTALTRRPGPPVCTDWLFGPRIPRVTGRLRRGDHDDLLRVPRAEAGRSVPCTRSPWSGSRDRRRAGLGGAGAAARGVAARLAPNRTRRAARRAGVDRTRLNATHAEHLAAPD